MYRQKAYASKLLGQKWRDKEQDIHKEKLRNIKPTINVK